jgi:hypothetical protein
MRTPVNWSSHTDKQQQNAAARQLVTVLIWHLPLFVMASFASSFFLGKRLAFMFILRTWMVKRSSGLHRRWF